MNDLTFYYIPNSKIKLEVTSTSIPKFYTKYLNASLYEINYNSQYKMLIDVEFRECIIGEFYISALKEYNNINFVFKI